MPKSDNIITVRLNETQMKKYHEGKVFTLKASDINNLENHEVRLHFNAKKHLTRLIKNFHKGTGTRINPNDLVDVKVKMGNGMFDSLKGVMSSKLTKGIIKAVAPQVGNIVGQQVKNLTGSDMASNLTKTLINEGAKEATGGGFNFNDILKSKITKGIVKAVAPQVGNIVGQQVKNLTGSDMASNLTKTLINEGAKEATGSGYRLHGIKRVTKKGGSFLQLGGSVNENVRLANMDMMNNGIGLTSTAPHFSDPTPMQRKMSELRAMRGRKNI
jgi:hypothetical protein